MSRLPWPFTPLESGEQDNFAFDATSDIGSASITSTSWVCYISPNQDSSVDPDPQSHIISTTISTEIPRRDPITQDVDLIYGNFSIATVGGFPSGAVGTVYGLEATLNLSDGRILKYSSTVECAPSPPPLI